MLKDQEIVFTQLSKLKGLRNEWKRIHLLGIEVRTVSMSEGEIVAPTRMGRAAGAESETDMKAIQNQWVLLTQPDKTELFSYDTCPTAHALRSVFLKQTIQSAII